MSKQANNILVKQFKVRPQHHNTQRARLPYNYVSVICSLTHCCRRCCAVAALRTS